MGVYQTLVLGQLEDIKILQGLHNIEGVVGTSLFRSRVQDIAQSLGLPDPPNYPRVMEFEAEAATRVNAANRNRTYDVLVDASRSGSSWRVIENSSLLKRKAKKSYRGANVVFECQFPQGN